MSTGEKLLLSLEEAQSTLSIGRTKLFDLLRSNEIASVKVGRRRVIPAAELRAYVERLMAEQSESAPA